MHITYDVDFERGWGGGVGKNEMLLDLGGGGLASVLDVQFFLIFFPKENWISTMNRHHAEPSNVLFTRNFSFESDVRH